MLIKVCFCSISDWKINFVRHMPISVSFVHASETSIMQNFKIDVRWRPDLGRITSDDYFLLIAIVQFIASGHPWTITRNPAGLPKFYSTLNTWHGTVTSLLYRHKTSVFRTVQGLCRLFGIIERERNAERNLRFQDRKAVVLTFSLQIFLTCFMHLDVAPCSTSNTKAIGTYPIIKTISAVTKSLDATKRLSAR